MALPPFEFGADQVNLTNALPATALTCVGAPGTFTRVGPLEPGALVADAFEPVGESAPAFDETAMGAIESTKTATAATALLITNRAVRL
jgi:hypothetical protein